MLMVNNNEVNNNYNNCCLRKVVEGYFIKVDIKYYLERKNDL